MMQHAAYSRWCLPWCHELCKESLTCLSVIACYFLRAKITRSIVVFGEALGRLRMLYQTESWMSPHSNPLCGCPPCRSCSRWRCCRATAGSMSCRPPI